MNQPILRARTQPQALVPASEHAAELDVELRRAQAIAAARNALPATYANNPGAVLVVDQWARQRGIDTLTAMQNVSFISGRPVVDATFQRAMATRAGYDVKVVQVSDESATVEVHRNGEKLGAVTWTMADAQRAKLAGKDNWKNHPKNMLVARATTDALRWHAPEILLGVWLEDEVESDPVSVLRAVPEPMAESAPPPAEVTIDIIEDAVLVDDEPEVRTIDTGWTVENLKVALKSAGLTQAQALMASHKPTLVELCKDSDAVAKLLAPAPTLAYSPGEEPF